MIGTEVDEKPVPQSRRFQVADDLGDMFRCQSLDRLKFDDQPSFHQQIGEVFTDDGSVLVINCDGLLLLHYKPGLCQAMCKGIFIDLFEMPVTEVSMNGISDLPHAVAEFLCFFV